MEEPNGNGSRWTKGLIAGISLTTGLAVGVVGMGAWAGGLSERIDNHVGNPVIHQTSDLTEAKVRSIIDREIAPDISDIKIQLDRIERELPQAAEVSIKHRIIAWYVMGGVADALGMSRRKLKEVLKMKPFPKFIGYLAALAAVAATAFTSLHPGDPLPGWITTITTLVAAFSHSATGTGGK